MIKIYEDPKNLSEEVQLAALDGRTRNIVIQESCVEYVTDPATGAKSARIKPESFRIGPAGFVGSSLESITIPATGIESVRVEPVESTESKSVDPKEGQASKKLCFDSVPATALCHLEEACRCGADKYGPQNWLNLEDGTMSVLTYVNAIQRHLMLFRAGQDNASDSGIHHLKHIMAGCAVALDAMEFGKVSDDRIKLSEEQIVQLEKLIVK